jgi:hypothetical protein
MVMLPPPVEKLFSVLAELIPRLVENGKMGGQDGYFKEIRTNHQRPRDATYGTRTNRDANGLDSERSQCHRSRLGWLLPLSQLQQNNDSFTSACGAADDDTLAEATQGQRQEYGIRQV